MQRWFAIFFLSVLVGGCGSAPSDSPTYVFDKDTSLDGIIESAELSSFRRGTHLLVRSDDDRIFLESKMVNLRQYEGMRVTVDGRMETNIDPSDWPVMMVKHVEGGRSEDRVHMIDAWGMEFYFPLQWRMTEQDGTLLLFEEGEEEVPIVTLYREEDGKLPKGVPIVVGGKRAERVLDEVSGHQGIYVLHNGAVIVFLFSPKEGGEIPKLQQHFLRLIQSVSFRLSEHDDKATTGTGRLIPCGGTAGILCLQGFYCDITDTAANIGHCVSLTPIP